MYGPKEAVDSEEFKSKSQLKREVKALTKLCEKVIRSSAENIKALNLPEKIEEEFLFTKKIKKMAARQRQIDYIGKLMRNQDQTPIINFIEKNSTIKIQETAAFKRIERWRDRLINESDKLIEEFIKNYPSSERQQLRQLVHNARKEKIANKPPKHSRTLFRYIAALDKGVATKW